MKNTDNIEKTLIPQCEFKASANLKDRILEAAAQREPQQIRSAPKVQKINFRRWATSILRDYAIRGYVIDRERMKNGTFFNENYFTSLLEEVREIRASERLFYQKITDIYATSFDYDAKAQTTLDFFAHVQNKLHFAIHRHTAAELIIDRASSQKEHGANLVEKCAVRENYQERCFRC